MMRPLLKRPRVAVVIDETVGALHGERLVAALSAAGVGVERGRGRAGRGDQELRRAGRSCATRCSAWSSTAAT